MQKTAIPQAAKSPVIQYALLAIISAVAVLYHVRLAKDILHGEKVDVPFFFPQSASATLGYVTAEAMALGLHRGDVLVAINGYPYTGTGVLGQELAKAKPGTSLAVTVRSLKSDVTAEHTVQLPVTQGKGGAMSLGVDLLLHFAVPIFCVLLAVWAVAVRPRDLPGFFSVFFSVFRRFLKSTKLRVGNQGSGNWE